MTTFTTSLNQVSSLYVGYFGRAGDPAGENYWIGLLNAGAVTLSQMASSFAVQPEATAKYPYLDNPNISDPGAFVDQVYLNLFNHVADAAGRAYWVAQLNAAKGAASAIGSMILNIISGATGTDSTIITNKVDVASDFTVKAAKAATDAYIASAPGPQQNFTLNIDTLTSSAQNANFNAPLIFNPATGTLVQSLQTGDSATDTAPLTGTGLSNGGTLTAVLNVGAVPLVTLKGIPTHNVTQTTAAGGYNGDITGLVTFNNISSSTGVTIGAAGNGIDKGGVAGTTTTAATLLSTVNLNNVTSTGAAAATTIFVNTAALAGAADVLTINGIGTVGTGTGIPTAHSVVIKNDTATGLAADNAYETLNINAAAAMNIGLADIATGILSTTRVNFGGAGATTVWGDVGAPSESHFTNITTIDAAAQTGGLTLTGATIGGGSFGFLTGAVLTSVKLGSGADTIDLSGMTAAQVSAITAGNLDGGTGRDALILSTAAAATSTTINNTGFEILGLGAGSLTLDFSKFGAGIDTIRLIGLQSAANTFNNLPSGLTFDLSPIGLGSPHSGFPENFNAAGTGLTDSITINFTNLAAVGTFTTTGFEVVNTTMEHFAGAVGWGGLKATASVGAEVIHNFVDNHSGGVLSIAAENIGTGGTLNITGSGTSPINFTAAPVLSALNASGYGTGLAPTAFGIVYLTAATSAQSFLGTAGRDVFIGSASADLVNTSAGNDLVQNMATGVGGVGVFDQIATGTGVDRVIIRGDVTSGALPALYSTVTNWSDMALGTGAVGATDWVGLSPTAANYAVNIGAGGLRAAATGQGAWTVQSAMAGQANTAVTNAANELIKFTTGVATAGLTLQAAFNAAIGTTQLTGATNQGSYFFTLYDTTNGRMDIGIVNATGGTDDKIESGDPVALVASVNMSAVDYASITANQFEVI